MTTATQGIATGRHALGPFGVTNLSEHELRYLRRYVRYESGLLRSAPTYDRSWPAITERRRQQIIELARTFVTKEY